MESFDDYDQQVRDNLRRIRLCSQVVDQVHRELLDPFHPERRADLLLEAEELASVSFELLANVREIVWHENLKPAPEDS
jgi:hypothetical protein